jgi:hypothetical protein
MTVNISFETNNAPFEQGFITETAIVLEQAKCALQDAYFRNSKRNSKNNYKYKLQDSNGNRIGCVSIAHSVPVDEL